MAKIVNGSRSTHYIIKKMKSCEGTVVSKPRSTKKINWKRGKSYYSRSKKQNPTISAPSTTKCSTRKMFISNYVVGIIIFMLLRRKPYINKQNQNKSKFNIFRPLLDKYLLFPKNNFEDSGHIWKTFNGIHACMLNTPPQSPVIIYI